MLPKGMGMGVPKGMGVGAARLSARRGVGSAAALRAAPVASARRRGARVVMASAEDKAVSPPYLLSSPPPLRLNPKSISRHGPLFFRGDGQAPARPLGGSAESDGYYQPSSHSYRETQCAVESPPRRICQRRDACLPEPIFLNPKLQTVGTSSLEILVSPQLSPAPLHVPQVPFGYTRGDVIAIGVGVTVAGAVMYYGLQASGVSAIWAAGPLLSEIISASSSCPSLITQLSCRKLVNQGLCK